MISDATSGTASRTPLAIGSSLAMLIKEIGGGARGARDLDEDSAFVLFAAMLAGEVPALELGAILIALRIKGESLGEMHGFMRALDAHVGRLQAPADWPRPVILPTYNGARRHPNLTALLALLLKRYGVPVLIHGLGRRDVEIAGDVARDCRTDPAVNVASFGRVKTLDILLELGIEPATSLADAQVRLAQNQIVYVPAAVLAPGLAPLLGYRARLGVRSCAHSLVKLIDPFNGDGYRVVSVTHPEYLERMREFLSATHADAMLLRGTEGEPFANPRRQTQIEKFVKGIRSVCAEKESGSLTAIPPLPATIDAPTTAAWIAQALTGEKPVPAPIIAQLACCLEGAHRDVMAV